MRLLVTGGRDYDNLAVIRNELARVDVDDFGFPFKPPILIHGGARGADSLAAKVARYERQWQLEEYPALWDKWGKSAGFRRNQEMVDSGADLCLAFPGGRGTMHCIRCAEGAGIPVRHAPSDRVEREELPYNVHPWQGA